MEEDSCNQSYVSDELTHFVGSKLPTDEKRFECLCTILKSGRLGLGQGNMKVRWPCELRKGELVVPEMVCFCDIPLKYLGIHMSKYGRFGLAFNKAFMRNKCGCNPVYYVGGDSPCTDHRYLLGDPQRETTWGAFLQKAFDEWYPQICERVPSQLERFENLLLWYVFGHLKFFDSTLSMNDPNNYYMEREWRLIGSMTFDLSDVARVILPSAYVSAFRDEFPGIAGNRVHEV